MNIEQVQTLIEMIGQAGDGAKDAFMWYLIASTLPSILGIILGVGIAYAAFIIIKRSIELAYRDDASKVDIICDELNLSSYSSMHSIVTAIKTLQEKSKNVRK